MGDWGRRGRGKRKDKRKCGTQQWEKSVWWMGKRAGWLEEIYVHWGAGERVYSKFKNLMFRPFGCKLKEHMRCCSSLLADSFWQRGGQGQKDRFGNGKGSLND